MKLNLKKKNIKIIIARIAALIACPIIILSIVHKIDNMEMNDEINTHINNAIYETGYELDDRDYETKESLGSDCENLSGRVIVIENTKSTQIYNLESETKDKIQICGRNIFSNQERTDLDCNNVHFEFKKDTGLIIVNSNGAIDDTYAYNKEIDSLNGNYANFIDEFKFGEDTLVTLSGTSLEWRQNIALCVVDGSSLQSNYFFDWGEGITFEAKANTEYGVTVYVKEGTNTGNKDVILHPMLEVGSAQHTYEKYNGEFIEIGDSINAREGATTIFALDGAELSCDIELSNECKSVCERLGSTVTFIDDDTSSYEDVKRIHDIFETKGVKCSYAVITDNVDVDIQRLLPTLKSYNEDGYDMIYHCKYQSGDSTRYYDDGPQQDIEMAEKDFIQGWERIQEYGFSLNKHWISPYGAKSYELQKMAKRNEMDSLIAMGGWTLIPQDTSMNRYEIPRISVNTDLRNYTKYKEWIDLAKKCDGWIVFVTHANSWGEDIAIDNAVADLIQYCIDNNVSVKTFSEEWENRKHMFKSEPNYR